MTVSEWNSDDLDTALGCRVFSGCGEDEVNSFLLSRHRKVCDFAAGEEIPPAQRTDCWAIVMLGSLRIFSGCEDESTVLLNVAGRGDVFDIAALTGRGGSKAPPTSVKAAGKCRVAFITAGDVKALMRDYPSIAANCFVFFTERIAFLNRRIHTLSCGNAVGKLSDFLLSEFLHENGVFTVRIKSYVELAGRLNISRASLYRALGALEETGVIRRTGKVITICDLELLRGQ